MLTRQDTRYTQPYYTCTQFIEAKIYALMMIETICYMQQTVFNIRQKHLIDRFLSIFSCILDAGGTGFHHCLEHRSLYLEQFTDQSARSRNQLHCTEFKRRLFAKVGVPFLPSLPFFSVFLPSFLELYP